MKKIATTASQKSISASGSNPVKIECHNTYFEDERIPVSVWMEERQIDIPMHRHDFSEIVLVLQGKGLHVTGHHTFQLKPRDVFVINGERAHQYKDTQDLKILNILYRPEKLELEKWEFESLNGYQFLFHLEPLWHEKDHSQNHISLDVSCFQSVVKLGERLKDELEEKRPGYDISARILLYEIILTLSRFGSEGIHGQIKGFPSMDKLIKAVDYIKTQFRESITLDDIANHSYMSKRSLNDYFLNCYGVTPMKYLNLIRLKNAAKSLTETPRLISEIAFESGFNDSNFFTRQFTRYYKVNPRKFRERLLKPSIISGQQILL